MILGPDTPRFPIGISDYRELRMGAYTYVDKTRFVADVLHRGSKAILIPRPRRFGKTLNLTTLRYFLEKTGEDLTDIFEDTYVWQTEGGRFRKHFQQYPVIWLSFREVKDDTWATAWRRISTLLRREVRRLVTRYDLSSVVNAPGMEEEAYWLADALERGADTVTLSATLDHLIPWITIATDARPVLLIDEYDAPLHTAYEHGYWTKAITFFRSLYSGGLKDNAPLSFGVLTGILRIVKASSYSGLNNTDDYNLFHSAMPEDFGFTEAEVDDLVERVRAAGQDVDANGMRRWYNGYQFGTPLRTIYNPWSVLKYLSHPKNGLRSHWKHSSDNAMVREQLVGRLDELGPELQALMAGGTISALIQDNILLDELERRRPLVWSLLTFTGYLTAASTTDTDNGRRAELRIPNQEVASVFRDVFSLYFDGGSVGDEGLSKLTAALLRGDAQTFKDELGSVLRRTMSYFDFGHGAGTDEMTRPIEAVYQAFVVGLLLHLNQRYRIRSNREATYGRADILVIPRIAGEPGAVLELKVVKPYLDEDRELAMQSAVKQLQDKAYADQVRADGAGEVFTYAVVFDGKRCWVEPVA